MIRRQTPPGCLVPVGQGDCLPECQEAGRCRARELRLVDGRVFVGMALGFLGETLRFRAILPRPGPVLLSFAEVEPLSLHEALRACTAPGDAAALLRVAEIAAARGLVDLALRDMDRAREAAPAMEEIVRERRLRVVEDASRRDLEDAREHIAAGRPDHARAALEEILLRFPDSGAAEEARRLRRSLVRPVAAG